MMYLVKLLHVCEEGTEYNHYLKVSEEQLNLLNYLDNNDILDRDYEYTFEEDKVINYKKI